MNWMHFQDEKVHLFFLQKEMLRSKSLSLKNLALKTMNCSLVVYKFGVVPYYCDSYGYPKLNKEAIEKSSY